MYVHLTSFIVPKTNNCRNLFRSLSRGLSSLKSPWTNRGTTGPIYLEPPYAFWRTGAGVPKSANDPLLLSRIYLSSTAFQPLACIWGVQRASFWSSIYMDGCFDVGLLCGITLVASEAVDQQWPSFATQSPIYGTFFCSYV